MISIFYALLLRLVTPSRSVNSDRKSRKDSNAFTLSVAVHDKATDMKTTMPFDCSEQSVEAMQFVFVQSRSMNAAVLFGVNVAGDSLCLGRLRGGKSRRVYPEDLPCRLDFPFDELRYPGLLMFRRKVCAVSTVDCRQILGFGTMQSVVYSTSLSK